MHQQPALGWPWKPQVVTGFVLVAVPLLVAFLLAARSLDETARLGRDMNRRIYSQTLTVHRVLEKISDVERKARLFVLLSDPAVRQPYEREAYEKVRGSFQEALDELRRIALDNSLVLLANELAQKEDLIHQQLLDWAARSSPTPAIDQAFLGLRETAAALSRQFEGHVEQLFQTLSAQTEANKRSLLWRTGMLLMVSFGLLITLLTRIERSLARQLRALETQRLAQSAGMPSVDGPPPGPSSREATP